MGIKNCTFSTLFSSIWVFASLAIINVTYAANEESLESQLKVYAQEAQEANLEQEIIAIIAEQIEEGSPSKLRAKYKSQVVAETEKDTASAANITEIKPTLKSPSVLNKDLKSAVEDTEKNSDTKSSDYRKSIQPDNEASTSRPKASQTKANQVKIETPNKEVSTSRSKSSPAEKNNQVKAKTETPTRKPVTQKHSTRTQKDRSSKKQGWIYVGQFSNNSWTEKMLRVDNHTLPKQGKDYLLNASVNIRDARPMKGRDLSPSVKILTSGDKIKLLKLHASGKKGHYWALIQWNQ